VKPQPKRIKENALALAAAAAISIGFALAINVAPLLFIRLCPGNHEVTSFVRWWLAFVLPGKSLSADVILISTVVFFFWFYFAVTIKSKRVFDGLA
jgi:preprotein translocase subunit SecY